MTRPLIVLGATVLFLTSCANPSPKNQLPLLGSASAQETSILDDLQEKEVVSGIWLFEDEQIEIKIARVDGVEQLPGQNKNATRFIIQSASEKLASYSTQRFKVDRLQNPTA